MVHTGNGLGFPATGKSVILYGSSFIRCGEGKLLEGRNFMDLTKMTEELRESNPISTPE
jgi:hypothetical protein